MDNSDQKLNNAAHNSAGPSRNTLDTHTMSITGSLLEAKEKKIGGAIYRANVDWTVENSMARKPLSFAVKGEGGKMLSLRHKLQGNEMLVTLTVESEYTDAISFEFLLKEVERTEVDTLKEMLDAQEQRLMASEELARRQADMLEVLHVQKQREEVSLLQRILAVETRRPAYLAVSSNKACGNGHMVHWSENDTARVIPKTHFTFSKDDRKVTVIKKGLYQIQVRLGGTNSANQGTSLGLLIDGAEIAQCLFTDANGYQNTAQLFEIVPIRAGGTIEVRCGCSHGNCIGVSLQTRLTVLQLAVED